MDKGTVRQGVQDLQDRLQKVHDVADKSAKIVSDRVDAVKEDVTKQINDAVEQVKLKIPPEQHPVVEQELRKIVDPVTNAVESCKPSPEAVHDAVTACETKTQTVAQASDSSASDYVPYLIVLVIAAAAAYGYFYR